jgi:hypothetical protein
LDGKGGEVNGFRTIQCCSQLSFEEIKKEPANARRVSTAPKRIAKGLTMNKKIFIQILKTILFSVIGGALGSLITFYFMSKL